MSNGYAIYPVCITVHKLRDARKVAVAESKKQENSFGARIDSVDSGKTIAHYQSGKESR